jgi:cytoskeletal protein CcmA (bactofilin family)
MGHLLASTMMMVFFLYGTLDGAMKPADRVEHQSGGDFFIAGKSVTITTPTPGDLIAAGQKIDLSTSVGGDAVLAAGTVHATGNIGQDLYAAGRMVSISGNVSNNARLAGADVDITPESEILGNVSVAAGTAAINGAIRGYLQGVGNRIYINAPVDGDVEITARELELGPKAVITGRLWYDTREEVKRDPAARILGTIEHAEPTSARMMSTESRSRGGFWIWTVGLMVLAAVLVASLRTFYSRLEDTLAAKFSLSLLAGFVGLAAIPVAAVVMFITLIGIPLGLLTVAAFLALILVGYVSTGIAIGDWALARLNASRSDKAAWRSLAAAAAILAMALFASIPWVGGLVIFAGTVMGSGAILIQIFRPLPHSAA